jgi:hypothetical protein
LGRAPHHGELIKLGIDVSQATVGRYLPWRPKVPSPTWRSFLHNHMHDTAAVDMFLVVTARFQLLYALVVLGHERRKVIHFDITQNPTQVWLARQITEAFPWDTAPRFLLRDRDTSYGQIFRDRVQAMAIEEVVTAPRSPWQSVTCAVYCRRTFVITTEEGRVQSLGPYSRRLQAPLSPSHRSAVCTIATSVARRKLFDGTCAAVSPQSVVAACNCLARMP